MNGSLRERVTAALGDVYDIEAEIGRGGMSAVYRAIDRRLQRRVAIKVLPPELAFDQSVRERFLREAQTAAQLNHPSIIPIYSVDDRGGYAYLVMALVTGGNLAAMLAGTPRPPLAGVRRLLMEVADALAYAHGHGVIHRDIKPDNILLDPEGGRAVVTDFGIARALEEGSRLTVTGVAVGTPAYMSPEQAMGEKHIDARSDIYSLGIVGYQMLAGAPPFIAANTPSMLMKQVSETPPSLMKRRKDLPRALCQAIEKALEKAPEARWQTAQEFREALERIDLSKHIPQLHEAAPRPPLFARRAPAVPAPAPPPMPASVRPAAPPPFQAGGEQLPISAERRDQLERQHRQRRRDWRLWRGAESLRQRIAKFRRGVAITAVAAFASVPLFAVGVEGDVPPFVLAPIAPIVLAVRSRRRAKVFQAMGLKARTVLFNPALAIEQIEGDAVPEVEHPVGLVPGDVLAGPHGGAVRQAVDDRAAIRRIVEKLPVEDRHLLPDVGPTVEALVDRVCAVAQTLHRLDASLTPGMMERLERRHRELSQEPESADRDRRLALLDRQRATLADLLQRRETLAGQLESAGLALANLRLDLLKLRESGLHAVIHEVTSATQEARALSREIGSVLDAAADVKGL